jgi:hypothetical protein
VGADEAKDVRTFDASEGTGFASEQSNRLRPIEPTFPRQFDSAGRIVALPPCGVHAGQWTAAKRAHKLESGNLWKRRHFEAE